MGTRAMGCMWRSEHNLHESVLSTTGVWGSNSDWQVWWQVPLPQQKPRDYCIQRYVLYYNTQASFSLVAKLPFLNSIFTVVIYLEFFVTIRFICYLIFKKCVFVCACAYTHTLACLYVYVCVYIREREREHISGSEDNFWESTLSLHFGFREANTGPSGLWVSPFTHETISPRQSHLYLKAFIPNSHLQFPTAE
jgi:hypothetical protein